MFELLKGKTTGNNFYLHNIGLFFGCLMILIAFTQHVGLIFEPLVWNNFTHILDLWMAWSIFSEFYSQPMRLQQVDRCHQWNRLGLLLLGPDDQWLCLPAGTDRSSGIHELFPPSKESPHWLGGGDYSSYDHFALLGFLSTLLRKLHIHYQVQSWWHALHR